MSNILEVKNLETVFFVQKKVHRAVDGVSFALADGKALAIVGESGSGKSVSAFSILQIVPQPPGKIIGGEIFFRGENLLLKTESELNKIRGKHITMVFQEPMTSLNPVIRVGEQIEEAILLHQDISGAAGQILTKRQKKNWARQKTVEILEKVGLPDAAQSARNYPHQLSGGMRQRVMIAMAVVCQPSLLIADEPTTALDVTVQAQILDLLRQLQKEFKTAIILITHDLGIVAEFADDVAVMYAGQIVEQAPTAEIFNNPLHPYTAGLLRSIPRLDKEEQNLYIIPGSVPNSSCYPPGCRFAPRCPLTADICKKQAPKQQVAAAGHLVSCHLAMPSVAEDINSC